MPINEVFILGEKLTIKGDASTQQVNELTRFINDSINEVLAKYPTLPPKKALILTLYNVAEEFQKLKAEKTEHESITKDIFEKTDILAKLFD